MKQTVMFFQGLNANLLALSQLTQEAAMCSDELLRAHSRT